MRKVKQSFSFSKQLRRGYVDYLGIDISKRTSVISHYFEDKFQKEFTIQNNKNGYNQLLKYLKKLNQP